jgi:hypothetical protein
VAEQAIAQLAAAGETVSRIGVLVARPGAPGVEVEHVAAGWPG